MRPCSQPIQGQDSIRSLQTAITTVLGLVAPEASAAYHVLTNPRGSCPTVGVLTGSDDSTVRSMLFNSRGGRCGELSQSAKVDSHAVGTHVKALAMVPEDDTGAFGGLTLSPKPSQNDGRARRS